jgi:hypothetical protein
MNYRELLEVKPQIESTATKHGIGVGSREFAWIYEPPESLQRLEEYAGPFLFETPDTFVSFLLPENTEATAYVHNHPTGDVIPTFDDMEGFLRMVRDNDSLRYGVICSTKGGFVSGYFLMFYYGETSEVDSIRRNNSHAYNSVYDKLHDEFRRNPNAKLWGADLLTIDEQRRLDMKILSQSKISVSIAPLPGFRFEDFKFLRE